MKLHHLGIACADISATLELIMKMFPVTSHSAVIRDPEQNANLCLVFVKENPPIELISGPVVSNLVKKGALLYHICWQVENMESAIERFSQAGCRLLSEPKKAVLFDNQRVAFMTTPVGLMELLESPR